MVIQFNNGAALDFETGPGRAGIGEVRLNGRLLRSGAELIQPEFATMDGLELDRLEFISSEERDNAVIIKTAPYFRVAHRMEWAEHGSHLRVSTASWSRGAFLPEGAVFEWIIRPCADNLHGLEYQGFSYSFSYNVPGFPIYQIEDKATWEMDGHASGHQFIQRGAWVKPVQYLNDETDFTTQRLFKGIANPVAFQHSPLYSQLQGFTFQYKNGGVLITSHEKPSHVRSYFEKKPHSPLLLHFNQFCFDMAEKHSTPARNILYAELKDGENETALFNHFLRVRDTLQQRIRSYYGLKNDITRPTGKLETWPIAKTENFSPAFDLLHKWGFKKCFLMPLWRSNETDVVPRFAEDREKFGILGNMCCPLELEIADCYGGWEGFKKVMERAVAHGIQTYMWFGSHFSSLTRLFNKEGFFAHDVNGQNNRNNYGHVLWAVNQNCPEFEDYFIAAYKRLGEYGLRGIFRDSHFNMASDTITYNRLPDGTDNARSMHDTEARIQSRFQNELGMLYLVESEGVMGTPCAGTEYSHVRGCEFIYSNFDTGLEESPVRAFGDDPLWVYFKGLSVRLIYQFHIEINVFPDTRSYDWWWDEKTFPPYIKAYYEAEPYMEELWLLDEGRGTMWRGKNGRVIFAWADFDFTPEPGETVYEPLTGKKAAAGEVYKMEKMGIYILAIR